MSHSKTYKGSPIQPGKPRGKPFEKRNKQDSSGEILDTSGLASSDKGGIIEVEKEKEKLVSHEKAEVIPIEEKEDQLVEQIDFKNGQNTLTIRFSKRHNRMFRIQIFLNDTNEIRPVTYTGASTGYAFWNLLKGTLKK